MSLSLAHYLVLGAILFAIGVVGILMNRRNVIIILMAIELMLLAVNMNFVAFRIFWVTAQARFSCSSFSRLPLPSPPLDWRFWWCSFVTSTRSMSRISIV